MIHVPPQKAEHPRIFWLGEAPSYVEENTGIPFTGPVGRLHDKLLQMAHVERDKCWTTNTIDFRLPDNNVENLCVKRDKIEGYVGPYSEHVRSPVAKGLYLPPEVAVPQLDRIRAELVEANPNIVVALGGLATWAMTALPGVGIISRVRGSVRYSVGSMGHWKVIPAYHPGYIRQNFNRWPLSVADYSKARAESTHPEIIVPQLDIYVPETVTETEEWVREHIYATPGREIAVDIETTWGTKMAALPQIDCIGVSAEDYAAICFPLFDTGTGERSWSEEKEFKIRKLINALLVSPIPKIFQNGSFDVQLIWERWRVKVQNYRHDTRLMHHALWPELPKDLGSMAATHTSMPGWKPVRGKRAKKED